MRALLFALLLFQQQPAEVQSGGTVSGRLVDVNRKPMPRYYLALSSVPSPSVEAPARYRAFTEEDGAFTFEDVRPGNYYLSWAALAPPLYYPGVSQPSATSVIHVAGDGSAVRGIEFVLPQIPTYRVSGRIVIPAGNTPLASIPEEGRKIRIMGGRPFRVLEPKLAADGSFETSLTPGGYTLDFYAFAGMESAELVVNDRDLTGLEFQAPRTVRVTGEVVIEGRTTTRVAPQVIFSGPMPEAEVDARALPDRTFETVLVDGNYHVALRTVPQGYYLKGLTAGSVDLLTHALRIDASTPPVRVVATLAAASAVAVSGRVSGIAGELPFLNQRAITFVGTATPTIATVRLNDDGSFAVEKLLPGVYAVHVALTSVFSSAPVLVTIPNKEVKELEIKVPGVKEVFGRVAVDGNGPGPRFNFLLVRGDGALKSLGDDKLPQARLDVLEQSAKRGGSQVMRVTVEPLADGSFKTILPEGEYRVASAGGRYREDSGVPEPFFIRSMNFGSAHLLTEPMIISAADNAELHVGFGVSIPSPWVKVSGHIVGVNSSQGPSRVALEGDALAPLETIANPDGSFELPMVLVGDNYVAKLPDHPAATEVRLSSVSQEVKNIELVVPPEREITIRGSVEGGGAVPGFVLKLDAVPCTPYCRNSMSMVVKPEPDGAARLKFPEDERKVTIDGLPIGYGVKSLTYGGTDLLKGRLKLAGADTRDLEVQFEVDPKLPTGSVSGRVTGLDSQLRNVQLALTGVAFVSSFETAVNADGSFSFSKIPQGTYALTLTGDIVSGPLTPASIVVPEKELIGLQIAAPRKYERSEGSERAAADPPRTGASVEELGVSFGTGNSSAAVANLRTINTALVTYLSASNGNYGNLRQLIDAGLIDESFLGTKGGYTYYVIANGSDYLATAVPVNSMGFGFYSTPDAVVRYSLAPVLSPRGQAGRAVQ